MAGFSILAKLGLDSSQFKTGLTKSDSALKKFGSASGSAVKAGAAIATAAFTAFTVKGVRDLIIFEKDMAEVFTLLPGITKDAMASMSRDVRNLATTMGVDLMDATNALYQAISAGVPKGNVFEFMEIASKAAIGGVTSLETAVDGITSVINTYGRENITAKQASDAMFTAVKLGKTTFDELSSSLYNVLPIAKQANVGFDEIAAALAVMTAKGTPTTVATTQLRQAITALIAPTRKTAQAFKDAGLDVDNLKALMAGGDGGLVKAMQNVMTATDGDEVAIRRLLGSTEAMNAVLTLTTGGAKSFGDAMVEMMNKTGATDAAFKVMSKTVSHNLNVMLANLKDLGMQFGAAFLPLINQMLPQLTGSFANLGPKVKDFAATFPSLVKDIANFATTLTKLGVAVGAYVVAVKVLPALTKAWSLATALLTGNQKGVNVAMKAMTTTFAVNPFGLFIAGATALGFIIKSLIDDMDKTEERAKRAKKYSDEVAKKTQEWADAAAEAGKSIQEMNAEYQQLLKPGKLNLARVTALEDELEVAQKILQQLEFKEKYERKALPGFLQRHAQKVAAEMDRHKKAIGQHGELAKHEKNLALLAQSRRKELEDVFKVRAKRIAQEKKITDLVKARAKEEAGLLRTQKDIDKVVTDVRKEYALTKTSAGQLFLLTKGLADLEAQKKAIIAATLVDRTLEADAAQQLAGIEQDILNKEVAIEDFIKVQLKKARADELTQVNNLVTELGNALQHEKDLAIEAGNAADAKEKEVAAFRADLDAAEKSLEPMRKFFQKDFKGKITPNFAEMNREWKKIKDGVGTIKLPKNPATFREFQQMMTDAAAAAKKQRDDVIANGKTALADATHLRAMEKTHIDAAKKIQDNLDKETKRLLDLKNAAVDKEAKTLPKLTKERKGWEDMLKAWKDDLKLVPPDIVALSTALNSQATALQSIDDGIADIVDGTAAIDKDANREKTQKELLAEGQETNSILSGYFVNQ